MNNLDIIRHACRDALEEAEEAEDMRALQATYISLADPLSVLELADHFDTLLMHADETAPELAKKIRAAVYPKR